MLKLYWILFIIILTSSVGFAQDSRVGTWNMATLVLPGDNIHKWGGCAELQFRTNLIFNQFQYYEAKVGLTYYISNNFTALVGVGKYSSYDYSDISKGAITTEIRLFEQITSNQFLYRLKIQHRYRVEQRWIGGQYRNRFRYRLNLFVPLNKTKVEAKTWFVSVFDEIFLNNKAPNFERNRVFAGLGYQFDRSWNVQAGWLNQYNSTTAKTNDKNYIMFAVLYRIHRKNAPLREYMPTTVD